MPIHNNGYYFFLRLRGIFVFLVLLSICSCTFEMFERIAHSISGFFFTRFLFILKSGRYNVRRRLYSTIELSCALIWLGSKLIRCTSSNVLTLESPTYACPLLNIEEPMSRRALSRLRPCDLWIVIAYAKQIGNCSLWTYTLLNIWNLVLTRSSS